MVDAAADAAVNDDDEKEEEVEENDAPNDILDERERSTHTFLMVPFQAHSSK